MPISKPSNRHANAVFDVYVSPEAEHPLAEVHLYVTEYWVSFYVLGADVRFNTLDSAIASLEGLAYAFTKDETSNMPAL